MSELFMNCGATFSEDRKYRPFLWRIWDDTLPLLCLIMLNPSKAGESVSESDPTVTRQMERARILRCGGILVVNAHDLVATDPKDMLRHPMPVSPACNGAILLAAIRAHRSGGKCIAAWGKHCTRRRQNEVVSMLKDACIPLWSLGFNKDGSPVHPLYRPYNAPLLKYPRSA